MFVSHNNLEHNFEFMLHVYEAFLFTEDVNVTRTFLEFFLFFEIFKILENN